jgi:hypothetical protein
MADIIDVQNAIVAIIAQKLYPNGIGQPSEIVNPVKIYPGWPQANTLDDDLAAATPTCHVSVFPTQIERNTTRYPKQYQDLSINAATLTLTINGQQVTVGGAQPVTFYSQNVMVSAGGSEYAYATNSSDTLTSIATALAVLIPGATNTGPVITIPNGVPIRTVRVGSPGVSIRELRRQERVFMVTIWAPIPALRDQMAAIIDVAFAAIEFLTLADQTAGRLIYRNSFVTDQLQKAMLYRRDLNYSVEYATTDTTTSTQVTQVGLSVGEQLAGITNPVATTNINA